METGFNYKVSHWGCAPMDHRQSRKCALRAAGQMLLSWEGLGRWSGVEWSAVGSSGVWWGGL
jgi:hypothetical protein